MPRERERPPAEELRRVFEESGGSVNKTAHYFNADWATAKRWLQEAGIELQEPKPAAKKIKPPPSIVAGVSQENELLREIRELKNKVESLSAAVENNARDWDKFMQVLDKVLALVGKV